MRPPKSHTGAHGAKQPMSLFDHTFDLKELSVSISELLVATADGADAAIENAVPEVLHLLREKMRMDVVFVSEFTDGQRVFRFVDRAPDAPALPVGASNPLEESYCQRVVDGRLPEMIADASALPASLGLPATPFRVGAHISTAIVLSDGSVYGTLCCFSTQPNDQLRQQELTTLKNCARLVARKVEISRIPADQTGAAGNAWKDTAPAPGD